MGLPCANESGRALRPPASEPSGVDDYLPPSIGETRRNLVANICHFCEELALDIEIRKKDGIVSHEAG
jgi:hypothetical protein